MNPKRDDNQVFAPAGSEAFDWLLHASERWRKRIGLIDVGARQTSAHGAKLTFDDLNVRAQRVARLLCDKRTLKKGDRVAILAKNSTTYLDALFACNKLGCILQTLNTRLADDEIHKILAARLPEILICDAPSREACIRENLGENQRDVTFLRIDELKAIAEAKDLIEELAPSENAPPRYPSLGLTGEDPWVICYTGGSTGTPKGALISYRQILANAIATITSWELSKESVAILNAPLFHVGGLFVFTIPLILAGGCSLVCDGFSANQVLALAREGVANQLFGVPTMFFDMIAHPDFEQTNFANFKRVIAGGAPCPEPIREAFKSKSVTLRTGYGLTECGPNNFVISVHDAQEAPDSVGYPVHGLEVQLVDDADNVILEGDSRAGELWLASSAAFLGYDGNSDATAAMRKGRWLRTGDLAARDNKGRYRIVGRKKEMFISGGENVYPVEIEATLLSEASIAEAAVLGVADERWGEVGVAFVAFRAEGHSAGTIAASRDVSDPISTIVELPQEHAVRVAARRKLAGYKVPKHWFAIASLPRTGTGKVDKPKLHQWLQRQQASTIAQPPPSLPPLPPLPPKVASSWQDAPTQVITPRGAFACRMHAGTSDETVILVHGNWSTMRWWQAVTEALPKSVSWLAYDLRGRGDSAAPDNDYSIRAHAEDLAAIVRALALPRIHIVGHSLGTAIALELALAVIDENKENTVRERAESALLHPTSLVRLGLLSPSWIDGMPEIHSNPAAQHALEQESVLNAALRALVPTADHGSELWRRAINEGAKQRRTASECNLQALSSWRPAERIATIAVPTWVAVGGRDRLTGPAVAVRVASLLGTRVEEFPPAGHGLPLECSSEIASRIAEAFTG
jgi:fatty-acyl-CoA synthase